MGGDPVRPGQWQIVDEALISYVED